MVDDDGHAVLSDFGLSKVLDDLEGPSGNTTTTFAGSVRWQAPELLFDGEDEDEDGKPLPPPVGPTLPADVWSFGCTIYEVGLQSVFLGIGMAYACLLLAPNWPPPILPPVV